MAQCQIHNFAWNLIFSLELETNKVRHNNPCFTQSSEQEDKLVALVTGFGIALLFLLLVLLVLNVCLFCKYRAAAKPEAEYIGDENRGSKSQEPRSYEISQL